MKNTTHVIGILGGTFDPIHFGHLRMGQEMLNTHEFTRIHFMPCYTPVHREKPIAAPEARLAMLQMAISHEPKFIADSHEIKQKKPSFTVDTLTSLKKALPSAHLCLLIGIDAFLQFLSWREPRRILEMAHILVSHRPHYELPPDGAIMDLFKKHHMTDMGFLHEKVAGGIFLQAITPLDISAKMIRSQLEAKQNPRYLLPDNVCEYIKTNQLYQSM
jgi:nicotinate-nucleotide adenylyltransferase